MVYRRSGCLLLLLLFSGLLAADRTVIDRIAIEGNRTVDEEYIKRVAAFIPGMTLGSEEIQSAITRLWKTELFSDIRIKTAAVIGDHATIVIYVQENKKLESVELIGNKKLSSNEINALLGLYTGKTITPTRIIHTRNALLEKYRQRGFHFAQVRAYQEKAGADSSRVRMVLIIDENKKSTLHEIQFHGNYSFSDRQLARQLKNTKPQRWWRKEKYDPSSWQADQDRVLDFYHNHGYRDALIQKESIEYTPEQTRMILHLELEEGPVYRLGNVSLAGNVHIPTDELLTAIHLASGERYNKEKIDAAVRQDIQGLYYERGYMYVQCVPQESTRAGQVLDLCFHITEGMPVRIHHIAIVGNTKTQEKIIRRELLLAPGEIFSRSLLERSQRELAMLNYFSGIEPQIIPKSDDQADIELAVKEKDTELLQFSAGWTSVDKLLGSLSYAMNNFLGRGQQTHVNAELGKSYRFYEFGFFEPYFQDRKISLGFTTDYMNRQAFAAQSHDRLHPFSEYSYGLSVRGGKKVAWPDDYTSAHWSYRWQRQQYGNFDDGFLSRYPVYQHYLDRTFHTSSVTQVLSHNTLDRPQFPTAGAAVSLTSTLAGVVLGGNVHYHQHSLQCDWFKPLGHNLVIHGSAQSGVLQGIGENANIPISEYYTIGGDGMSRSIPLCGYPDPLSENGASFFSGKAMLKVGAELRLPLVSNPEIYLSAFAEAGNVWSEISSLSPLHLQRAAGMGIRMNLPLVGIVGVNYGYAFDRKDDLGLPEPGWGFQFILGKSF